ncbi:putative peptidoglycan glycosyltransferase FtsW [Geminicoccaceae bacterium 1502E]|nr:putative peptidoglycan glycosyltransferase FtsW [Geminicoccaceae bacterium 1502E]
MFSRTDRSILGDWWWTVDRTMLTGLGMLAVLGVIIVFAASPPVAATLGLDGSFFITKHVIFLLPAAALMFGASVLAPRGVLRLGLLMMALFGFMLVLAPFFGAEIKGARRWISVAGTPLQPSEFVKPALAVVTAWLLSRRQGLWGMPESLIVAGAVIGLLLMQPDLGMVAIVGLVYMIQLFVAGLPWIVVVVAAVLAAGGAFLAYEAFPHVQSRVDMFLDPETVGYQVEKALRAVASGGLFGRGPGEGVEKFLLPDAHTDFVFAAAAEEFGIFFCLIIVALFLSLLLRGIWRVHEAGDRFVQLAATGLVCQFGLQALINMAVNLNLMPTKGMTLPFISYGGSSMLALALGMGMLLALTRRNARLES